MVVNMNLIKQTLIKINTRGSGKILWNIYRKYGLKYKIRWSKCYGSRDKAYLEERKLIKALKDKHSKACINILPGGQGGEGYKWSEEKCIKHKLRLNEPDTKIRMSKSQTIAQNRPERKELQSEIMNKFYREGGSQKVSEATSKAQRTALHWHEPLKSEIYEIWISLGKPTTGPVVKALKGKYNVTPSALKNLIYSFRAV